MKRFKSSMCLPRIPRATAWYSSGAPTLSRPATSLSRNTFPVIEKGGSINGVIAGLNRIIEITIPKDWQEGGTMVIPGHGRICDEADVVEYRDMVTIIRDRIQAMVKKGMTLDQVKAARPTLEYDSRYGSDSGPWTTSMFIEAVYRNLSGK